VLGALVGKRHSCRIVHVESGLTSGRIWDPFPEEIARRIVFRLAHVAMCPSEEAREVLRKRRCEKVLTNGNTILDAVELAVDRNATLSQQMLVVASIHRFQNIYSTPRLSSLVRLLIEIADSFTVKLVLHPATRKRLEQTKLMVELVRCPGVE